TIKIGPYSHRWICLRYSHMISIKHNGMLVFKLRIHGRRIHTHQQSILTKELILVIYVQIGNLIGIINFPRWQNRTIAQKKRHILWNFKLSLMTGINTIYSFMVLNGPALWSWLLE